MQSKHENKTSFDKSLLGPAIYSLIGGLVMPSLAASAGLSGLVAFITLNNGLCNFLKLDVFFNLSDCSFWEGLGKLAVGFGLYYGSMKLLSMILGQDILPAILAPLLGCAVVVALVIIVAAIGTALGACFCPRSDAGNDLNPVMQR